MKLHLFFLVLLWGAALASAEGQKEKDWIFSEASMALEGGDAYPWGNLEDAIKPALYGQGEFSYRYWENTFGLVQFGYGYFRTQDDFKRFPGVHQFHGRVGLEHQPSWMSPLFIGAGFSCILTRSDGGDPNDKSPGVLLATNETEFGAFVKLKLPIWKNETYAIGVNLYWEEIWTLPQASDMLWIGFFVQRRLW